ncbi:MAG: hypothetical protein JOY54_10450 [Acidobacteriaceae bacterium]|nr:hypothetical protein [Acidobacteriaceae bacterium]
MSVKIVWQLFDAHAGSKTPQVPCAPAIHDVLIVEQPWRLLGKRVPKENAEKQYSHRRQICKPIANAESRTSRAAFTTVPSTGIYNMNVCM